MFSSHQVFYFIILWSLQLRDLPPIAAGNKIPKCGKDQDQHLRLLNSAKGKIERKDEGDGMEQEKRKADSELLAECKPPPRLILVHQPHVTSQGDQRQLPDIQQKQDDIPSESLKKR